MTNTNKFGISRKHIEELRLVRINYFMISERLKELEKSGFFLESFLIRCNFIEFYVKSLVRSLQLITAIKKLDRSYLKDKIEQPLGPLIQLIEKYFRISNFSNKKLIKTLKNFNIKRKALVHRLLLFKQPILIDNYCKKYINIQDNLIKILRFNSKNYDKIIKELLTLNAGKKFK